MAKEWKIFLTAIMFLTRIRVPRTIDHSPVYLQRAPRYFPVVGWIVGIISSLVYFPLARYISPDLGIFGSMVAGIFITGALHEDGFADVCDGFGGGWTKEKILLIMKDSRVGAYGVIGLVSILGGKFLLLRELPPRYFIPCLIAAHSLSRLIPVIIIRQMEYVSDPAQSKSGAVAHYRLKAGELALAIIFALVPFLALPVSSLLAIIPVCIIAYMLAQYFKKWIGGYTGDCLGAAQQVSELCFYLGFVIIMRFT